ncbi:MAG: ATP-binding protein [Alphaproteobacteria bacterium]
MLDLITDRVRRLGPVLAALAVTAISVAVSALATGATMILLDADPFPALYLAIGTPFVLALPITLVAFGALERANDARAQVAHSEAAAQAAQATLSDALENIPNPTMILGPDERIQFRNRAWRRYYPELEEVVQLGMRYEDIVRTVLESGLWDPMGPREEILEKRLGQYRTAVGNVVQELADGRFILANTSRSRDGGTILTHTDITDLKRIDRLKDEFVSMVSHELRTPITSIKGSLDMLATALKDGREIDVSQFVDIANRNAERMLAIVNDILLAQGIQAGGVAFDVKPTPMVPLVQKILSANAGFADRFGVAFRLHDGPTEACASVDADRFGQVLTNLLSNAAKFAPRDSTVEVSVRRLADRVEVSVHDEGPGIPKEYHERVFERFWRADTAATSGVPGTGLGLSIARQMVEGMGGHLDVESELGKGTTFRCSLPLALEPESSALN